LAQAKTDDTSSKRAPERHKRGLIDATLDLISEIGIPDTTVSLIIERAGVSRGMIHLHFGSKDKLLIVAIRAFCEDYDAVLERVLEDVEQNPVERVMALIRADLGEALLNERSARIWHAFRGVANPSPDLKRYCGTRDGRARDVMKDAFVTLARQDHAQDGDMLVRDATFGTLALLEGMYVDYLSNTQSFSRRDAERIIRRFIAGLFPDHF